MLAFAQVVCSRHSSLPAHLPLAVLTALTHSERHLIACSVPYRALAAHADAMPAVMAMLLDVLGQHNGYGLFQVGG